MLAVPYDGAVRGPWPVGEKTVRFGRFSAVELFYPAIPGSETGKETIHYDLRTFLPASERHKIPDAQAVVVDEETYRDLPIDAAHGPYPVVIFVHGTAEFRLYEFSSAALWASRGFVVMAADHPGFTLADSIGGNGCASLPGPVANLSDDVDSELAALGSPSAELSLLRGRLALDRVGLVGHSAGAYFAAQYTNKPGVRVFIGLAGVRATDPSPDLRSVLYVAGMDDKVLPYKPGAASGGGSVLFPGTDSEAYAASPGPPGVKKRLVGIQAGGHLSVTDGCEPNPQGRSAVEVAAANGVCGISSLELFGLVDCGSVDRHKAIAIVHDVTTAALEETLQCADVGGKLSSVAARHPDVGDFHEAVR